MAALRLPALHLMADGMHQVRLAHADAAVEEERVVGLRWAFGDGFGRGARKLVAGAGDEAVEGVAGIELRGGVPVEARLLRRLASRCGPLDPVGRGAPGACERGRARKPPSSRTRGRCGRDPSPA